ncbi:hypothetical protein HMPREF0183_0594 [Brevibacterium mcbrellneri ATCC 49030]|uniref:Uncharacterized protein n=1 Tax=Brevibacterium mcbrellneri ATCC 49030 TaxID=585530 RepID=D4YKY4_9MICO|nr:hypothetical protein [Brevibacterium mcbrellneri]EFG48078.1 hypothetical protein HMPREF0183_0594 [Brevibacterium mcbrellneri ATCC 49030]
MIQLLIPLIGVLVLLVGLGSLAWRVRPTRGERKPKARKHLTRGGLLAVGAGAVIYFVLVRIFFMFDGVLGIAWIVALLLLGFIAFRVVQLWPSKEHNAQLVASLQSDGVKVGSRQGVGTVITAAVLLVLAVLYWFAPVLF